MASLGPRVSTVWCAVLHARTWAWLHVLVLGLAPGLQVLPQEPVLW